MKRLARTAALLARASFESRAPFASPASIERVQGRRVHRMVRYAWRHVTHFREAIERLGATPDDFTSAADLARLPLIGPADLQRRPEAFAPAPQLRQSCIVVWSGGNSGSPRAVAHDADAVFANAAHGERERTIVARTVGRRAGYHEAVFAPPVSATQAIQDFVRGQTLLPESLRVRRTYFSLAEDPTDVARRLADSRPHVVHGFGSYVGVVFRQLAEKGYVLPELRAVTYSSDALSAADRTMIVDRFAVPVLSTYQAVEALKIGFECGEGDGLHVNVDLYPVRIVDEEGVDVPPGVQGSVVVSNLVNRATVLLNYRLGDRASLLPGPCLCGRNLPRISLPLGRDDDWIAMPDGRRLHSQAIRNFISHETSIHQYQVIQEGPRRFALAIVGAPDVDREAVSSRLRRRFAERVGSDAEIVFDWVDAIERTAGGKARSFVRRWG